MLLIDIMLLGNGVATLDAGNIAWRRLVLHSVDAEFLDLETSTAGQWCLQSLKSSVRELRVAAGSVA